MKQLFFSLSLLLLLTCFSACQHDQEIRFSDEEMTLYLRWIPSFPNEKEEDIRTGLAWGMSLLGAEMPIGCMDKAFYEVAEKRYLLNINLLGFSEKAKKALLPILKQLKKSEEYSQKGGIDIGRFLVLTLHSSWNYYAITAMPKNYFQFKKMYAFDKAETFPIIKSSVAIGNRIIHFPKEEVIEKMAFIAEEGTGEWENSTFETTEIEVFDMMKNGQLRFGIYNKKGDLKAASPLFLGSAGKPGKCMWCHESHIQKLYSETPDPQGYMSAADFSEKMVRMNNLLYQLQVNLQTEIDWNDDKAHTLQEWLYIGFMEPNLERIAADWEMTETEVLNKISAFPTHLRDEFLFFGTCYDRINIDAIAPYHSVRVPESVREPSVYEPNE